MIPAPMIPAPIIPEPVIPAPNIPAAIALGLRVFAPGMHGAWFALAAPRGPVEAAMGAATPPISCTCPRCMLKH